MDDERPTSLRGQPDEADMARVLDDLLYPGPFKDIGFARLGFTDGHGEDHHAAFLDFGLDMMTDPLDFNHHHLGLSDHGDPCLQQPQYEVDLLPDIIRDMGTYIDPGVLSLNSTNLDSSFAGTGSSDLVDASWQEAQGDETANKTGRDRSKKSRTRFSQKSKSTLSAWYHANEIYPYPSAAVVSALASEIGHSERQVRNWFANARTRSRKSKGAASPSCFFVRTPDLNHEAAMSRTSLTSLALERLSNLGGSQESVNSIERYLKDTEARPTQVVEQIQDLAAQLPNPPDIFIEVHASVQTRNPPDIVASLCSDSSFDDNRTDGTSGTHNTSGTNYTSGTHGTRGSISKRRGKRQYPVPSWPCDDEKPKRPQLKPLRKLNYACTFCPRMLANEYDWKRHETTHTPSAEQWICMPDGSPYDNDGMCMFCFQTDPPAYHLERHGVHSCLAKKVEDRCFSRKDHLKQHIDLVHRKGETDSSHILNSCLVVWRREPPAELNHMLPPEVLWCGFCKLSLPNWRFRQHHVANHFRSGRRIETWVSLKDARPSSLLSQMLQSFKSK